jgi:ribosome-associated protein
MSLEKNPIETSENRALLCAKAVIDKSAENIKIFNLTGRSGFTDYFVICSGSSDRKVQAISDSVSELMESSGATLVSTEGYTEGRWVLMDFGDVVVHIFLDALRDYYDLDRLWADAPQVKIPPQYYAPAATRTN